MDHNPLELNITNLNSILDSLDNDLREPYLHNRPKFDENLALQVQHALNEVQNREKDLKACIGISKIILAAYKALKEKSESLETDSKRLTEEYKILEEEVSRLKVFEEKFYETDSELKSTESELSQITTEYRSLIKERSKKSVHMSYDSISLDRFSAELTEMSQKFKEEYDAVTRNFHKGSRNEAEKRCKDLEIQLHRQCVKLGRFRKSKNTENFLSTDIERRPRSSLQVPRDSINLEVESSPQSSHSVVNKCPNDSFRNLPAINLRPYESIKSVDSFENEIIKSTIFNSACLEVAKGEDVEVRGVVQRRFTEEIYFCMVRDT